MDKSRARGYVLACSKIDRLEKQNVVYGQNREVKTRIVLKDNSGQKKLREKERRRRGSTIDG